MDSLRDDIGSDVAGKHINVDVVCGMDIIEERSKHQYEFRGTMYYFCSQPCLKHFSDYPERYVWDKEEL